AQLATLIVLNRGGVKYISRIKCAVNIRKRNFLGWARKTRTATGSFLALHQLRLLQQRKDATNYHGVCVKLAGHILGGLQYVLFDSEQKQGVDAGCESGIDGHIATLT